jgi:hypothetical protein
MKKLRHSTFSFQLGLCFCTRRPAIFSLSSRVGGDGRSGVFQLARIDRASFPSFPWYWRGGLAFSQRARVQRGESSTARCASTGNRQAAFLFPLFLFSLVLKGVAKVALYCAHRTSTVSSCAFCEQRGHLAAPLPPLHLNI